MLLSAAIDLTFLCVLGFQESFTQQRRKTGRRRTPTSTRLSKATTPSTAHEPSQPLNTCCSAKSCSTCKFHTAQLHTQDHMNIDLHKSFSSILFVQPH